MCFSDVIFALPNKQLTFFISVCKVPFSVLSTLNGLFQLNLRTALGDGHYPYFPHKQADPEGSYVTSTGLPGKKSDVGLAQTVLAGNPTLQWCSTLPGWNLGNKSKSKAFPVFTSQVRLLYRAKGVILS